MSRRASCAAMLASLLVAACGGSGHTSHSATSSTTSMSATATASSSTAAASSSTTTSTVSAGPTTTTATTSSRPPEVPKSAGPKHSKPTAPSTNVRIPAAFTITAQGAATPPLISVPPGLTIELRLHNEGAKALTVTLSVPHFAPVAVPAHGSSTTEVSGVRKGTYRLLIDGAVKARIVVGAAPGP